MGSKSSKSPKPPDPYKTADAQAQANKDAIITSALVNRTNTITPWGSVTWERPGQPRNIFGSGIGGGKAGAIGNFGKSLVMPGPTSAEGMSGWTQRISLSPAMQEQFDQQNARNIALGDLAQNRIGQIDTGEFSLSGLPQLATGLNTGQLPQMTTGLDTGQLPEMATSLDTSGLPELNQDYSADAQRVEQATFDRAMQLMNPQFQERERALQNRLAVMGQPVGGEAYGTEMDRYDRMRNEAELAAALQSVGAGRAEQSRLFDIASRSRGQLTDEQLASAGLAQQARQQGVAEQLSSADLARLARQQGVSEQQVSADLAQRARQQGVHERTLERQQPMNELAMLLGQQSALQAPQAPEAAQYQVAPADIAGLIQSNYQTQANQAGAKKGGTSNLIGQIGGALIDQYSDVRLKQNIRPIGEHNGHKFYTWDWNGKAAQFGLRGPGGGVIAQEVEQYAPELIGEENGYKTVNYAGIL